MHNAGFNRQVELESLIEAWLPIFSACQPDVVISDFAPVAAILAVSHGIPLVTIGTGYCNPPGVTPMVPMSAMPPACSEQLEAAGMVENRITTNINSALLSLAIPEITSLGGVYATAKACLLTTHPEFDHYQSAIRKAYYGVWKGQGESVPSWRAKSSRRTFAYLKPFPNISKLFSILRDWGIETKVLPHGITPENRRVCSSRMVEFLERPIDFDRMAPEVNFVITNGNHGTTLAFAQRGVPVLACPLHIEQKITGMNLAKHGFGDWIDFSKPETFAEKLGRVALDRRLYSQTEAFAAGVGVLSERENIDRCVHEILACL